MRLLLMASSNPLSMRRTASPGLRLAFSDASSFPLPGLRDMEYTPFATWSNPDTPLSSLLEGCASRRIRQRSARRAASNRRTGESIQMNKMPSIGTTLTYGEAIEAYDRFERTMLEKAYGAELLPAVGLYDLLCQLESLAQKFGIEGKGGGLSRGSRGRFSRSRARGPPSRTG